MAGTDWKGRRFKDTLMGVVCFVCNATLPRVRTAGYRKSYPLNLRC